jgi:putative transposase
MAAGWPRRSGLAGSRCGWLAELEAAGRRPGGGPVCGQCWTLARIADQVWRRFGAEHTLARMDVLLHRIGR